MMSMLHAQTDPHLLENMSQSSTLFSRSPCCKTGAQEEHALTFTCTGGGQKVRYVPRNKGIKLFGRDILGFCWDILVVLEKFEKKVCVHLLAPDFIQENFVLIFRTLPARPKLLQKYFSKEHVLAQSNFVKTTNNLFTKQLPSHVVLQRGTNQSQQHYKESVMLETEIITKKCSKDLFCNRFGQDGIGCLQDIPNLKLGGRFGYFLFLFSVPGRGEREEASEEVAGGAGFLLKI